LFLLFKNDLRHSNLFFTTTLKTLSDLSLDWKDKHNMAKDVVMMRMVIFGYLKPFLISVKSA